MKKTFFRFFLILFSASLCFSLPWRDNAFMLVETGTTKEIVRAIETDYSFGKFTRYKEKENLLMAALKYARGNDVIDILLKQAKISPDSKTKNGITSLMYACQYETDIDAVSNVLFTGAKSDSKKEKRILATDKDGQNSFDYARKNENISLEILDLLNMYADEPIKISEEPPAQETPKEESAEEPPVQDSETETFTLSEVKELPPAPSVIAIGIPEPKVIDIEEKKTEESKSEPEKNTLLDLSKLPSPSIMSESIYLYDYADDKYSKTSIPQSLIAIEEASKRFISDTNIRNSKGQTKLMLAAKAGDLAQIENLLYSGAQLEAKDDEGWTALMYAARFQKNPDVTKLLLYKGANRTAKNKYGITALLLAAGYTENTEVLAAILEAYNANSDEVREAFAYGISNYNTPQVLEAFIKKNVPLNIPYKGKTPLMVACETNKNTQIIEWLLKNGASKYQTEASTGKTAYDYAKENKKLPHNEYYWALNPNS